MKRKMHLLFGFFFVGLGILGAILPVMPSTCFFIIAAYFFGVSSPRFENWLLTHPKFGPPIVAWREKKAIPLPAKWAASTGMSVSMLMIFLGSTSILAQLMTLAVILPSALFIWTRPH